MSSLRYRFTGTEYLECRGISPWREHPTVNGILHDKDYGERVLESENTQTGPTNGTGARRLRHEGRGRTALADDILTVTMLNRSAPPTPRKPARAQCQE